MAVLAAVRERKTRRIVESRRRAVHDFGNEGQRLEGPRAELFEQEKRRKVPQLALLRECQARAHRKSLAERSGRGIYAVNARRRVSFHLAGKLPQRHRP